MSFTGKATYTAGATLPEIAEDVSDLVAINSPHETALLDALGDGARSARSTVHEWLEDSLLPNSASVVSFDEPNLRITVSDITVFQIGDQITIDETGEVLLVESVDTVNGRITVMRGYGGTTE